MINRIGEVALDVCYRNEWAGMGTAFSWPVPVVENQKVYLHYLMFTTQISGGKLSYYPAFGRVRVSYPDGAVIGKQDLPAVKDAPAVGQYPYPEIAHLGKGEKSALWDALAEAYPGAIAAFAGWPAGSSPDDLKAFAQMLRMAVPSFYASAYYELNPQFFAWVGTL
jgi:hypothetical protein